MIVIKDKSNCSGCHACMSVCPEKCIEMQMDNEGFLYPNVNIQKCIKCGLCEKVCQQSNSIISKNQPQTYASYHRDKTVQKESSSGGLFFGLAKWIIDKKGVVFGAAFDESLRLSHIAIDKMEDIWKIQGSKYIQSVIGESYLKAKDFLEQGRYVLFTGTPCQIEGLKLYLKKDYERLYTQDFICHGVPSPKIWENYILYQEQLVGAKIDKEKVPLFREKTFGWNEYSMKIIFENGEIYKKRHYDDLYMKLFLENYSIRPSCYTCRLRSLIRNSDITLGDFWKIEKIHPEMYEKDGVSCVWVNSEKGKVIWEEIKENYQYFHIAQESTLLHNKAAYASLNIPLKRDYLFEQLGKISFEELCLNGRKRTLWERIENKIKTIIKKI